MKRREFITLLGGAAAVWPVAARAQQAAMPVIGFLRLSSPGDSVDLLAAMRRGLKEAGYVEGQNVMIEYRWAENRYERLPELAADLVRRQVAVIIAGGNAASLRAKVATTTIPVVFATGEDPVQIGLVASLSRPGGGNVTGVSFLSTAALGAKRVGLMRELMPTAAIFGYLINPNSPTGEHELKEARTAALALGLQILVLSVGSERDLEAIFASLIQQRVAALIVPGDPIFYSWREHLTALVARHALPAIFDQRDYAVAGGLMNYGASITDAYRQVGLYAGRILKGEKPADLPVMLPSKFEFVINLKTAKMLGLRIPPDVLSIADEVIE